MSFKSWWNNENYSREHMAAFRRARPDWGDLPDHLVASSVTFAWFAFGEAVREFWTVLKREVGLPDKEDTDE